jgi:hypothetical protein
VVASYYNRKRIRKILHIILIYKLTHAQVWDVDYFRTDHIDSRTAAGLVDPDGTIDGRHAGTVGLTSACPAQGAPAADGVTRGQTLGA